jgi:hypothetical protein
MWWFIITTLRLVGYSLCAAVWTVLQTPVTIVQEILACTGGRLHIEIVQLRETLHLAAELFVHVRKAIWNCLTVKGHKRENAVQAIRLSAYLAVTAGVSVVTVVVLPFLAVSFAVRIFARGLILCFAKPKKKKTRSVIRPMRTNPMMRIACIMLICTTLSTSVVGGTLAKYTTRGKWGDSARIAKWNVSITSGVLFLDDDAVQPGNEGSAEFAITGVPEVDVTISLVDSEAKDIYLADGEYQVLATIDGKDEEILEALAESGKLYIKDGDTYRLVEDGDDLSDGEFAYSCIDETVVVDSDGYYPVEYTLTGAMSESVDTTGTKASDIKDMMETAISNTTFSAGTDLSTEAGLSGTVSWSWTESEENKMKDEILNNMSNAEAGEDLDCFIAYQDTDSDDGFIEVTYEDNSTVTADGKEVAGLETNFSVEIDVSQAD